MRVLFDHLGCGVINEHFFGFSLIFFNVFEVLIGLI